MDALTKAAMKHWPDLAGQMLLRASDWSHAPLARRKDGRVAMVALRMTGPGPDLVLKLQRKPVAPDAFAKAVQSQIEAAEAFPDGVPLLHAVDVEAQACVMDFADGVPLAVALRGLSLAEQATVMRRAGAWLGGWHRACPGPDRVFQPRFTLNFLQTIVDEIGKGKRDVCAKDRFLAATETLLAQKAKFEGRRTKAARTHGDLHMRNLLIGEKVWGIDFAGGDVVPVGHDIGRLLADFAILFADPAEVVRGSVLPERIEEAFFEGYGLVGPDDPSVQLLLRHRILAEWWGLPVRELSSAQQRRWHGIDRLVGRVFGV